MVNILCWNFLSFLCLDSRSGFKKSAMLHGYETQEEIHAPFSMCLGTGLHCIWMTILTYSVIAGCCLYWLLGSKHTCNSLRAISWVEINMAGKSGKCIGEGSSESWIGRVFVLRNKKSWKKELLCVYMNTQVVLVNILYPVPVSIRKDGKQKQPWWRQPSVFIETTNNSHRKQEHWIAKKNHVHKLPRTRPGTRKEANTLQTRHRDHRENRLN